MLVTLIDFIYLRNEFKTERNKDEKNFRIVEICCLLRLFKSYIDHFIHKIYNDI